MGVAGFPGPQREIEGRFEFGTNKDWCIVLDWISQQ